MARVQLIRQRRDDLEVEEAAMPVVRLLVDQPYDLRRLSRNLTDGGESRS